MTDATILPRSFSEMTAEWLTDALRVSASLDGRRVTSVDSTLIGNSNGLMSQVARLRLSYDAPAHGLPELLIAKLPPADAASHSVGVHLGFFEREARFYQELAGNTSIRAPRCYFTRYEPAEGRFLTLLEDLSQARLGDSGAGCGLDDAMAAIRALAGLHASWWESGTLSGLPWLRTRSGYLTEMLGMIDGAWPNFVARFESRLGERELSALAGAPALLRRSPEMLSAGPLTLLHGDYKLDNMFFLGDGGVVAFDWGLVMNGPAAYDVASFVGLNVTPEDRRRHEVTLIRAYADTLAAHGVRDYSFDACVADYHAQLVGLLPQLIVAGGVATFADEDAIERYATGVRRVLSAVDDHGTLEHSLMERS